MLVINEEYVNSTKGHRYGSSDWYEPFTDDLGRLFREIRKEYGRCTGHIYTSTLKDDAIPIGWVFVKRAKYDDTNETYLQEAWVAVVDGPEVVKRTVNYVEIGKAP